MLSTVAVTASGASSPRGAKGASIISKDDSCTSTRTRRPTGGAPNHRAVGASLSMATHGALPEFRSRHQSATAKTPPPRLNIYRRTDHPTAPASPTSRFPSDDAPSQVYASYSEGATPSPKPLKRESWLQRSLRSARSHRLLTNSTYHLSHDAHIKTPVTDRPVSEHVSESGKKSPSANPLAGLLERLRPRSGSEAVSAERLSSLGARRKKGWLSNAGLPQAGQNASPAQWTYECRELSHGDSHSKEFEDVDAYDPVFSDEEPLTPVRRKRSSSDTAQYIIMRKTSRPHTAEVMGHISRRDVAYKQLLKKFTCYDLMPTQGAVVAVDSELSTRQALVSLAENGVRAGFIWDSTQQAPIGFVTVTDFLRIVYWHFSAASPVSQNSNGQGRESQKDGHRMQTQLEDMLDGPILSNLMKARNVESSKLPKRLMLTTITSEDTLLSALTVLRLNRLHRIPVLEVETNNPLFLLSSRRLLQFLHEYMHSLPMTTVMYKTLDELRIGTWIGADGPSPSTLVSLTTESSMINAVEKFLQSGASSLPILHSDSAPPLSASESRADIRKCRLIDALTKVDLMNFVLVNGWSDLHEKTVADVLKQRNECMERLVTCHRKTTLTLAVDRLVSSQAHRLYIVDSDGVLQGLLSIGDLLSYLNENSLDDVVQQKR